MLIYLQLTAKYVKINKFNHIIKILLSFMQRLSNSR